MTNLSVSLSNPSLATVINTLKKPRVANTAASLIFCAAGVGAGFLSYSLIGRADIAIVIGLGVPLVVGGGSYIVYSFCKKKPNPAISKELHPFFAKVFEEKGDVSSGLSATLLNIFSHLEVKDLLTMRCVCKRLQQIIDTSHVILYRANLKDPADLKEFIAITKNSLPAYKAQCAIAKRKEAIWKASKSKIASKKKELKELEGRVDKKNADTLKKIKEDLEILRQEKRKANHEMSVENCKREPLLSTYKKDKRAYENWKMNKRFLDSLFGKDQFDALPVLKNFSIDGYYIEVKPTDVTTAIMRGRDAQNRLFFTLRARNKNTNEVNVQTFFQGGFEAATWGESGDSIVPYRGNLMTDGKVNEEPFEELKTLVWKGENENYILA